MRLVRLILVLSIASIWPARANETVRRSINGLPWQINLPSGYCAIDPANSHDEEWLKNQEYIHTPRFLIAVFALPCDDLKSWRTGNWPKSATLLKYNVLSGTEQTPAILKLGREEYLNYYLKFLKKQEIDKDENKLKLQFPPPFKEVIMIRNKIIDRDTYAIYRFVEMMVNGRREIQLYASTKIQMNPIEIQIEQPCKELSADWDTLSCINDQTIAVALALIKSTTRSMVTANEP